MDNINAKVRSVFIYHLKTSATQIEMLLDHMKEYAISLGEDFERTMQYTIDEIYKMLPEQQTRLADELSIPRKQTTTTRVTLSAVS